MSVQFLCLTEFGCFLFLLSWRNYLFILNLSSLLDICLQIFSLWLACSSSYWCYDGQKFSILMKINLSGLFFVVVVVVIWSFGVCGFLCLRNIYLAHINKDILLFCSEMLMISGFTFRSITCLILHFVYGIK